ncbi:MAG: HD domain-containing protein [Candidatus Latescibacterota bacterium]
MQCPGQDTRYWKPGDIFEIPCEACGTPVEFFKTDVRRRCPRCGKRIQNPRVSLGCARWCSYARECLGFDPKALELADSAETSLTDRLVQAVKAEFGQDQAGITHSLLVLDQAQDLLRREGGDPRVVLAASVLHDIGMPEAGRRHPAAAGEHHEEEGPAVARRIMGELGFEEESIEHVCAIVGSHHSGGRVDSVEFRIVWDADRLLETPRDLEDHDRERLERMVDRLFRTESGRQRAHAALAPR